MTVSTKPVQADSKAVRAFFVENPDLIPEGDKTVGQNSAGRGRISKEARAVFTEKNPGAVFFERKVNGPQMVTITYKHEQPSGRKVNKKVDLLMKDVRGLLGNEAPQRGRLSAGHLAAAGEAYAKTIKV